MPMAKREGQKGHPMSRIGSEGKTPLVVALNILIITTLTI